ncbi:MULTISPECIES: imidazole glycerol phosphate synthase subunit HisH [Pseudomonas]|jgi:glutamine amidotransferase|uniref:imidazole glycerol phosphate synthase subunit HisH n=1 Tax=Pseudomonas TaxID=286 RepID=UPI0009D0CB7D|nr:MULTISPECIES: imidazole glycerol phosphate synthase subunit HisH [Pseudomonas]OPK02344.1 imidazole glycerol phosphate synthase subunit HisH [Pseudomonas veronii]UHG99698.1 imidazole glycerol phosphate synthase subunit HisH [Pseudomonas sp. 7-41]WKC46194.1 imidazole glycerol phosphate synthase subunit HisH [Pseudomonas veronii]
MIVIVDYDIGNVAAVSNMLMRLGIRSLITSDAQEIEKASKIILPGNGSFDACMKNLKASGLIGLLEGKVLGQHTPLLGICVGAQMLGKSSSEGNEAGLGWLDMEVKKFPEIEGLRVPHMGWNDVFASAGVRHYLTDDIENDARFYFVHSYFMQPADPRNVILTAKYGLEFAAGVAQGNICGVQFHPEKSHRFGKRLLNSFARGL